MAPTAPKPPPVPFTRATLVALPPAAPGKRAYYHDAKSHGLVLAVTATGHKSFHLYRKVHGKPERITLGTFDPNMPDSQEFTKDRPLIERVQQKLPLNIKKARALADAVRASINNGAPIEEVKRVSTAGLTIGSVFDRFLKERRNKRGEYLAEKTKKEYQGLFDSHLKKLRNQSLSALTPARVKSLHAEIGKNARYSANRAVAVLSSLYSFAISNGLYRGDNPAKGITPFPEPHRTRFIQPDEMPRFFAALAEEPSDFRDAFLLALLTGARRSDVLSMQWAHVHLQRGTWTIPVTKNGRPLDVVLITEAVALLKRRLPDEEATFVFPGRGKSGHLTEPKGAWKRLLERAGIKNLRFHDMRHTVGSALAATGANMATSMQALGHLTPAAALIYQKMHQDPIRHAMENATSSILKSAGIAIGGEMVPINRKG